MIHDALAECMYVRMLCHFPEIFSLPHSSCDSRSCATVSKRPWGRRVTIGCVASGDPSRGLTLKFTGFRKIGFRPLRGRSRPPRRPFRKNPGMHREPRKRFPIRPCAPQADSSAQGDRTRASRVGTTRGERWGFFKWCYEGPSGL